MDPLVSLHYYAPVRVLFRFFNQLLLMGLLFVGLCHDQFAALALNRGLCSIFRTALSRAVYSYL